MSKTNVERIAKSLADLRREEQQNTSKRVGFPISMSRADEIIVENYKKMKARDEAMKNKIIIGMEFKKVKRK